MSRLLLVSWLRIVVVFTWMAVLTCVFVPTMALFLPWRGIRKHCDGLPCTGAFIPLPSMLCTLRRNAFTRMCLKP